VNVILLKVLGYVFHLLHVFFLLPKKKDLIIRITTGNMNNLTSTVKNSSRHAWGRTDGTGLFRHEETITMKGIHFSNVLSI
jgi:hypothetical protein